MKPLIVITTAAISFTAVASFRPIHKAADYNQVIPNPEHEVGRIPAIGFDDSTGEFADGGGGSFTPPTAPEVDVSPPVDPEPEEPTAMTIDCGCAQPWLKSYGREHPENMCWQPEISRSRVKNITGSDTKFDTFYGDFWPQSDVSFYTTYNLEGETPVITKVEAKTAFEKVDITSKIAELNLFAFEAPDLDVNPPTCKVVLVNPGSFVRRYINSQYESRPGQGTFCSSSQFEYTGFAAGTEPNTSNYRTYSPRAVQKRVWTTCMSHNLSYGWM